jgi:hypothetical protein
MSIELLDESKCRQFVIDFITAHQGCIAEDIVKGQDKIGRKKVFRILKDLKNDHIVLPEKSKINSRNIKLYIDGNNLLVSVPRELVEFKETFFNLLTKVEEKISDNARHWIDHSDLAYDLIVIYQHVVGIHLLNSLLNWPKMLKDKKDLNKLNAIFFGNILEIQSRLSDIFKVADALPPFNQATGAVVFSPLSSSLIRHSFHLSPSKMLDIVSACKAYQILDDIKPVLDIAWKIGSDVYPYTEYDLNLTAKSRRVILKDWRLVLGWYMYRNKFTDLAKTMNDLIDESEIKKLIH